MTDSNLNKSANGEQDTKAIAGATEKRPDDAAGILVQGHIKIYDPESGETLVNKRTS